MAEAQDGTPETRVFPGSLDDYRTKVEEIIRSENERLRRLSEEQAKEILDGAWQKAEAVISESQQKAARIIGSSEQKASEIIAESRSKAEEIINDSQQKATAEREAMLNQAKDEAAYVVTDAKQVAQRVLEAAEENAKKEAKNRVKEEEDKLLDRARAEAGVIVTKARENADEILSDARKAAERETAEIIERSKKEAELLIQDEIEHCRQQAMAQSAQIKMKAEKDAEKLINDITDGGREVNESILMTLQNAETLLATFREEVQAELGELTKRIVASRNKLRGIASQFDQEEEDSGTSGETDGGNQKGSDNLWVYLNGEKSGNAENGRYLFKGQIDLRTLSSFESALIKNMKKFLIQVPNVKYLGESSTEEGTRTSFELKEPLPLVDILGSMPSIRDVMPEGENLRLTLQPAA